MSKLYTIQLGVPICPECGGGLRLYTIFNQFRCFHCGEAYKVVRFGQNEREFICEKENKNGKEVQSTIREE